VYLYKYKDSNTEYVIANSSDNVSPTTGMNTYFISSVDNGQTWSKPICISNELSPESFFYFGDDKMIVNCTGLSNFYFESNDGGNNWSKKSVSNVDKIRSLHFVSKNIGFIKTGHTDSWVEKNSGHVFRTLNGGVTWQQMTNETVLGSRIYFIDENTGFLQDLDYRNGQILLETQDGGKTWKEVLYPYPIVVPQ
ncbi:MAG: hypothetical protein Q8S01_07805, partial [Ignavibacteria bacterium]|nr:hypothetical protein [Ignavibacteria bacterium]